jgi:hypothetical protein
MPIFDIYETKEASAETSPVPDLSKKDRFFSALTARVLFLVLLASDLAWMVYSLALVFIYAGLNLITFDTMPKLSSGAHKHWISFKRSFVCAIALAIAIFSPPLGIMIACTYFLMYDKGGIEEVVPTPLQEQFQQFLKDRQS